MKKAFRFISIILLNSFLLLCLTSCLTKEGANDDAKNTMSNEENDNLSTAGKIQIKRATSEGCYCKEFILENDINEIQQILMDAIGDEIHEGISFTGGWTLCINLYYSDDDIIVVTPFSDTIIQIDQNFYFVKDSDWQKKSMNFTQTLQLWRLN